MKSFNVIWWDFNEKEPEPYDVIPYLVKCYNKEPHKPQSFEAFRDFIEHEAKYMWWSRCQYEIIITQFPPTKKSAKWDIYQQIMMNIDLVTQLLMESINK